jgi:hypothetical protein
MNHRNENHHVVIRTVSKPPKEYKTGEDFRTFVNRFNIYCDLNNIPQEQKTSLLFTLLDTNAFTLATNLRIEDLEDYPRAVEILIRKFESPAGALGNQIRLNNRKQLRNESLIDYFDALCILAQRTNMDQDTQHTKIIETIMDNATDPYVRNKILKLVAQAQDDNWQQEGLWQEFKEKIHALEKIRTLKNYNNLTTPTCSQSYDSDITLLAQRVQALLENPSKNSPTRPEKSNHRATSIPNHHNNSGTVFTPQFRRNFSNQYAYNNTPNYNSNFNLRRFHNNKFRGRFPNQNNRNFPTYFNNRNVYHRENLNRFRHTFSPYQSSYNHMFTRGWTNPRNDPTPRAQPKNFGCGAGVIPRASFA